MAQNGFSQLSSRFAYHNKNNIQLLWTVQKATYEI